MEVKIEIKSIFGNVLFEYSKENNTIKDTVEEAVRRGISLNRASLDGASLDGASLNGASLDGASLNGASLYGASLNRASLYGASLNRASLNRASLYGALDIPYIPLNCPSDGAFIGWKKVDGKLIQLLIPEDAKRSSATTNKCRCSKAKVLSITSLDGEIAFESVVNKSYDPHVEYKVGGIVSPDSFDENRWDEYSHGIHFFINKQDAINY